LIKRLFNFKMDSKTITFEVNVKILKEIESDYVEWTLQHMKQVLEVEGFISAQMRKLENESNEFYFYSICYIALNKVKIDLYFKNNAQTLRQSGIDKFGDKWSIERRIMLNSLTFTK